MPGAPHRAGMAFAVAGAPAPRRLVRHGRAEGWAESGGAGPRNDPALYGGSYPFIQTGDVRAANGRLTTFSQTYNESGLAQSRLWPRDTVRITIAANIAETALLDMLPCFPDSIVGFIAAGRRASLITWNCSSKPPKPIYPPSRRRPPKRTSTLRRLVTCWSRCPP